jgi:hypothetical protein
MRLLRRVNGRGGIEDVRSVLRKKPKNSKSSIISVNAAFECRSRFVTPEEKSSRCTHYTAGGEVAAPVRRISYVYGTENPRVNSFLCWVAKRFLEVSWRIRRGYCGTSQCLRQHGESRVHFSVCALRFMSEPWTLQQVANMEWDLVTAHYKSAETLKIHILSNCPPQISSLWNMAFN